MKFLLVPDSFKGTMNSEEFCFIVKQEVDNLNLGETTGYPIADGGEGTVENLVNVLNGTMVGGKANDGNFFIKNATYGIVNDTAYIAVANTSGLPNTLIKDPLFTTTYGLGEQIKQAIHLGKKKIVLCLGGSSTNDCGTGMLCALGARFLDENDQEFIPSGGTLAQVKTVDLTELYKTIAGVEFIALYDVNNPLTGEKGCSKIYARQKGANDKDIEILEENMIAFAKTVEFLGVPTDTVGAGSAGGLGYAVKAFLKGNLYRGIEWFLDVIDFDNLVLDADYILTGEGRFDETSLMGKAVGGIADRAVKAGKKITVFCGESPIKDLSMLNVDRIIRINDVNKSGSENARDTQIHFRNKLIEFLREIKK